MTVPAIAALGPLRVRQFRVMWAAWLVSNIGSFVQAAGASWLMLELTGSALWVSLVVSSSFLPLLVFALPAGALADIGDRRRVVLAAQTFMALSAVGMALVTAAGRMTPALLLGSSLLLSSGAAFSQPAWQALVPQLVAREMVADAAALHSATYNTARAIGPALGGLLTATAGPSWAFAANAVSFVGVLVVFANFRPAGRQDRAGSFGSAMALGVRYAQFSPPFRRVLLVAGSFALTSAVLQALLPTFTAEVLGGGAFEYGVLLGAMGGGALAGALVRRPVNDRLGRRMVPAAIAGFGLAGLAIGAAATLAVTVGALVAAGALWVWMLGTMSAMTQLLSPDWVRGRLIAIHAMAFVGLLPLGSVVAGVLAEAAGVRVALVVLSGCSVALGLAALRLPLPALDRIAPPRAAGPEQRPSHPPSVPGAPVTVINRWVLADADIEEFLVVMGAVRRVRIRTGAHRWWLSREVEDPHRFAECYQVSSWEEHLRQYVRSEDRDLLLIARARTFDRADGPMTIHLAGIDVPMGPSGQL